MFSRALNSRNSSSMTCIDLRRKTIAPVWKNRRQFTWFRMLSPSITTC
jgi:hypothetical protein